MSEVKIYSIDDHMTYSDYENQRSSISLLNEAAKLNNLADKNVESIISNGLSAIYNYRFPPV